MSARTDARVDAQDAPGVAKLRAQIDRRIAAYFSSCVHCGLCADACLFHTETGDPRYTPIHKLEPMKRLWRQEFTFWGKIATRLGLTRKLTDDDLAEWEELVYDSCTLCGRCSMVCPVGIDISHMIRKEREGLAAAGHAPRGLRDATARAVATGSPMGVTLAALRAQIKHVEQETGLTVPIDRKGAQYLALLSSLEIMGFPETIASMARIFDHAGVSWTLSSQAFEATNSGIQIGDSEVAAKLVERIVAAAQELAVEAVISPECGHAFTAIRWEGPNLIGRPLPFEVVHIVELLDRLRAEGRLRTSGHSDARLSFHDPCNLVRKGGVVEAPRRLLGAIAPGMVEMKDHGVMNWCCGGGGGVSANERATPLRLAAFGRKKKQIDELGVDTLVTACANCRNMLEDGLEHHGMEVQVVGLTELVAAHLAQEPRAAPKP